MLKSSSYGALHCGQRRLPKSLHSCRQGWQQACSQGRTTGLCMALSHWGHLVTSLINMQLLYYTFISQINIKPIMVENYLWTVAGDALHHSERRLYDTILVYKEYKSFLPFENFKIQFFLSNMDLPKVVLCSTIIA